MCLDYSLFPTPHSQSAGSSAPLQLGHPFPSLPGPLCQAKPPPIISLPDDCKGHLIGLPTSNTFSPESLLHISDAILLSKSQLTLQTLKNSKCRQEPSKDANVIGNSLLGTWRFTIYIDSRLFPPEGKGTFTSKKFNKTLRRGKLTSPIMGQMDMKCLHCDALRRTHHHLSCPEKMCTFNLL